MIVASSTLLAKPMQTMNATPSAAKTPSETLIFLPMRNHASFADNQHNRKRVATPSARETERGRGSFSNQTHEVFRLH